MKKIETGFIKKIVFIVISILAVVFIILGSINLAIKDNKIYDIRNIENGWDIEYGDSSMTNINVANYNFYRLERGEIIIATKKLKKINESVLYPIVELKTKNCLVDIYIDGKKVVGNFESAYEKKVYIKRNFTAQLPSNYDNKEIKIKFYIQDPNALNIVEHINIMSENNYVNHKIRSNLVIYLVSSIIIILGIILIVSVICIPYKNSIIRRLLWIGGTFLFAGLSMYAKYDILELFISNSKSIELIENTSIFLCMPCVAMVGYETFRNNAYRKYIISYCVLIIALYLMSVVFNTTGIILNKEISDIYTFLMYTTALLMMVFSIFNYKQSNSMEKISIIGMIICYCQGMITILISQLLSDDIWNNKGQYYILGIILEFFICMIIYYAYVVKKYMNGITEQRILATLAYTDPLTGLMNRTKYEEVLAEIKNKDNKKLTIISFDLNNLKKINDNNGHEAGDIYIKEFTKAMKKSFENYGFIGRIGGDEFISIIEDKSLEAQKQIEKMQKVFVEGMNNKKCEFEASFAYGIADSIKDDKTNVDDLIALADSRMYECKSKQKLGRN